ncbi:hypothetical protein OQA88_569 [Cercophora sp. LCS_1]
MTRATFRRALFAPIFTRATIVPSALATPALRASYATVPKVAQTSFWKSMVPKFLRPVSPDDDPFGVQAAKKARRSKEWNPATFFIVIFLSIGSMSINMIALKKDFAAYVRRSDTRIGQLREVIERLQNGEEVDVGKALGTGDAERESEWEQVINELAKEEVKRKEKKKRSDRTQEATPAQSKPVPEPIRPEGQTAPSSKAAFY